MKIIKINQKLNEILVIPETLDDLWHLEKIIEKNDIIYGKTDRKIKPSKEGEKTIRQTIFVELEVENVHFQEFSENLKIGGIIIGGNPKEFIELKAHQSIDIIPKEILKIKKTKIQNWQIERLKKAQQESSSSKLLAIIMDDESAELLFVNQFSTNKKAKIKSNKQGKMYSEQKSYYFDEILEKIKQLEPKKILIVGPGFVKENFKKFVEEKHIPKFPTIITETINSVGETGLRELLSSGKLELVEKNLQLTKETQLIEDFLKNLSKNKAEYGTLEIKNSINDGKVEQLLISEKFLLENRKLCEEIMDHAEKFGTKITIISSKNSQEKIIYNMGGIVATLRYVKQEN
ncbi:MAG: mRNA surveillance protein pelota [Candidatus ainarchaeum sp.]|nr:mRNA surveillance protein pelota [Candidatus ainarchaeum sp.]